MGGKLGAEWGESVGAGLDVDLVGVALVGLGDLDARRARLVLRPRPRATREGPGRRGGPRGRDAGLGRGVAGAGADGRRAGSGLGRASFQAWVRVGRLLLGRWAVTEIQNELGYMCGISEERGAVMDYVRIY